MKKIITIITIIIVVIIAFFIKTNYKKIKFGNNMSNKSAEEVEQYILGISSYEVQETITVESNKNTNNYIVKEKYSNDSNVYKREMVKPENLSRMVFIYDGTNLKIENSKLNLSKIYENYPYVGENIITLKSFIDDYKESNETSLYEENEEIILEVKIKNGNKYVAYKKLHFNKSTGVPTRLEIKDVTQKTVIYILYNEIKINNLQKEDVLAFKLKENSNDI